MKPHNSYLVLSFGILFSMSAIVYGLMSNKKKETTSTNVVISKCDSLQLANNQLQFETDILQDRITKYKVGLEFLKDKDPRAYRFVMNAGNLEFDDRL
jgi:hypothetical protein